MKIIRSKEDLVQEYWSNSIIQKYESISTSKQYIYPNIKDIFPVGEESFNVIKQ